MPVVEVRDSDLVRQYILQGLWLNRSGDVSKQAIVQTLDWAMQLASADDPIPPVGILTDIAQLILADVPSAGERTVEHLPPDIARQYEDYVLGKFYADATFERGATAVCRYQGADRNRASYGWSLDLWTEQKPVESAAARMLFEPCKAKSKKSY